MQNAHAPEPDSSEFNATELLYALDNEQFLLVFQPKVALCDYTVSGVESFLRWDHPSGRLISPGEIMCQAQVAGDTVKTRLDCFSVRKMAEAATRWRSAGYNWPVSANIDINSLTDPVFLDTLRTIKDTTDFSDGTLVLEFMESALAQIGFHEVALPRLYEIRDLGYGLAIEASSVPTIPLDTDPCPFTELKIGTAAVLRLAGLLAGTTLQGLFERIDRAHDNNIITVAIGIQDTETLYTAQDIGIMAAQGRTLAEVMSSDELDEWLLRASLQGLGGPEIEGDREAQPVIAAYRTPPASVHRFGRGLLSMLPDQFRRLFLK